MMQNGKQDWDKRAWVVGLASGSLCGIANTVSAISDKTFHSGSDALGTTATLTANFVLPAVMALLARRRFLFWGLLPPLILVVWVIPARCVLGQFGQVHRDLVLIPVYVLLSVGLVSGPISLVRSIRSRRKQRHIERLAAMKAQQEAASISQEGVWPPPPDYRENNRP